MAKENHVMPKMLLICGYIPTFFSFIVKSNQGNTSSLYDKINDKINAKINDKIKSLDNEIVRILRENPHMTIPQLVEKVRILECLEMI